MTQEDRELLLKDLCARLPYMVIVHHDDYWDKNYPRPNEVLTTHDLSQYEKELERWNIKPYLRPVSDMTEDEIKYITDKCGFTIMGPISDDSGLVMHHQLVIPVVATELLIDFYNSHHIDWRGMIEKGLALKATEGMYDIK